MAVSFSGSVSKMGRKRLVNVGKEHFEEFPIGAKVIVILEEDKE